MNVLIVGARGGIGAAMVSELLKRSDINQVIATFYRNQPLISDDRLQWYSVDITKEKQIEALAAQIDRLDWIINCVGLLHTGSYRPEKTARVVDPEFFMENIRVNTLPSLLLAKHFERQLRSQLTTVFATISAKVGSINDNRLGGWYSYRASKAALNMVLKTLSLEWRYRIPNCCVASLHPGTTDTLLSKPFQGKVAKEKLFAPEKTATHLIEVILALSPQKTGRFWSWDGSELSW